MKLEKIAGATSEIWQVYIQDTSKFDGSGLTGLTNASVTTAYYHRDTDTTATSMSLVSMTVGTFTSLGFKEIDSAHMPGWYQFCPPNAALASGAKSCAFYLAGATNMAAVAIEVQLTAVNFDSATAFITGVNSVVPPTNWNLMSIDSNGRVDVIKLAGTTQTARDIGASVLVGDKTGFSLSTAGVQAIWDALTSALTTVGSIGKLLVDNINAAIGSVPTATQNADALLKRDLSAVTGEAARSPLNALRWLRNKWSISSGTMTVCKEDDSTTAWTATVATTAGDPVSSVDPT